MKDARRTDAEGSRPAATAHPLAPRPWRAVATLGTLGALIALLALAPPEAAAQSGTPGTQEMIQALRPQGANRNLVVRPRPPEGGVSAAGSAAGPAAAASSVATVVPAAAAPAPAPTPAPVAAPAAPAAPAGPAPSLSLAIEFDSNSARVRPESGPLLGNLVAALQSPELKGTRFVIEGHTDARGNPATNQRLSQERADEVRLYLVALGVHPARLRAVGKGSSEPAVPQDPAAAANRRVRLVTQP
jgi:outer membrane protein OmpA-like peptidoglycan-associated protein